MTSGGGDLAGGMEREPAGALEPDLVRGAREELEQREAVAAGSVAQVRAFAQRAGGPGQFAAGEQQRVELVLVGSAASDATTPGAPWHHWVRTVPLRCTRRS